jgi:arabinogalactan oligomer / maltooligosaccharide transport system permease protein
MKILREALVHALLVLVTALVLYPVLWVVGVAVSPGPGLPGGVLPWPSVPSLGNFWSVIARQDSSGSWLFPLELFNSVVVSVATTVVGLSIATTAAYGLSRFRFPGQAAALGALAITQIFPSVAMSVPLYFILDLLHLNDSRAGLVVVYSSTSVPFCIFSLRGYFDTIPKDLDEAARVDGATRWQAFTRVVLPIARPGLAVTALFAFMSAWNEFILAATFLSSERSFTLPVALQRFVGEFDTAWGAFAAGSIVVSLPVVVLFYALQKHMVGGLAAGGVKG